MALWKGLEQTALPWVKVLRVKSGQVVMEKMGHISDFFPWSGFDAEVILVCPRLLKEILFFFFNFMTMKVK